MFRYLTSVLNRGLEIIFPKRPDAAIVDNLNHTEMIDSLSSSVKGDVRTLLTFKEPHVRACIHELKFHRNQKAVELLSIVLIHYLEHWNTKYILLPVPLAAEREKKRGYNQVSLLAHLAAKKLPNCKVYDTLLRRTKNTAPQTSLSRKDRLQNMTDAFTVPSTAVGNIANQNLILLDDVMTTGATLKAAQTALLPCAPTSITCLAIAH